MLDQTRVIPMGRRAAALCSRAGNPVELLRALLTDEGVVPLLRHLDRDPAVLLSQVPAEAGGDLARIEASAAREAALIGHRRVEPVHLLLGMLYTDVEASAGIRANGLTLFDVRSALQRPDLERTVARRAAPRRRPLPVSLVFIGLIGLFMASGAGLFLGAPGPLLLLATLVFVASGWVVSLCIHEFAHAAVAYLGGDRMVARPGYLRLDPLSYVDPLFSILIPLLFVVIGGIGLPGGAVYIDRNALRSRGWGAAVSIAGPVASLCCAVLFALPFILAGTLGLPLIGGFGLWAALAFLVVLEIGAVVLNLIPIPPLDGFGVISALFLRRDVAAGMARWGGMLLMGLFILLWVTPAGGVFWQGITALAGLGHVPGLLAQIGRQDMTLF
ncbi:MAG TPA: site-2 protease family protein [Candidatus Dormibacteraeota bacterium]|nr:site-2 protease family protein [Candidatus Dormibacteraeota bacterium]